MAAKSIYDFNSKSKIIIIPRDPVERAISHYRMDVAQGRQKELDAYKAIKSDFNSKNKGWGISNLYIELSQYEEQVKRYIETFGKNELLILDFDELKNSPKGLMEKISQFLNIDGFEVNQKFTSNPTLMPKNAIVKKLSKLYRNHISKYLPAPQSIKKYFFKKPEININQNAHEFLSDILKNDIFWYKSL